jgi:phosphoserine phosphatase
MSNVIVSSVVGEIKLANTKRQKVNVIDLDNTLLPYDSLTRYALRFMFGWRNFAPFVCYSLLRITGILPRDRYLKKILARARKVDDYADKVRRFSDSLYRDINSSIINFVLENTEESTTNVLCTASPQDYVQHLSERLGWKHLSSTLDDAGGSFLHMYGKHKVAALQQHYPSDEYDYHLAISDSRSDLALLRLFEIPYVARNGNIRRLLSASAQKTNR